MSGTIFRDTLRTNWKQVFAWGIGTGLLGLYIVSFSSDIDVIEQYASLLGSMPPAMLSAFGFSDAAIFASIEGFISSAYVLYAMLLLSVYGVAAGLSITSSEEEDGILDIMLALPVSRSRFVIEKSSAHIVMSLIIVSFCVVLPAIAIVLFRVEVDMGKVLLSIASIYPGILLVTGVSSFIGTCVRRRTTAIVLAALFVIGSYFLNFLGSVASETPAGVLQELSYFYHTNGQTVILNTFNPLASLALMIVALGCMGLSIVQFNRRDIGL